RVTQSGEFLPGAAAVHGLEQRRVLRARIDGVRIGRRGFEMPDAFELPGVLGAVVPLVSARYAVVFKLVADSFPGFSAIFRALYHLPKPAAGLRRIHTVRSSGGTLKMINLPAAEMRPADFPLLSLAVGGQDECSFPRTN